MMRRRVMALLLAAAVAGIPEALAVCRVVCAWSTSRHDAASSHSHEHTGTAGDRSPVPVSALSITDESHPCGHHREQVASLTARAPERAMAVAIATPVTLILPPLPTAARYAAIARASRSAPIPQHTPLRV